MTESYRNNKELLIYNVGHLPVKVFLVLENGIGFLIKLNIKVIMNLF